MTNPNVKPMGTTPNFYNDEMRWTPEQHAAVAAALGFRAALLMDSVRAFGQTHSRSSVLETQRIAEACARDAAHSAFKAMEWDGTL